MKLGATVSSAAHAALLAWGLVSLQGPEPLQMVNVEAVPVDIVPIEELTRSIEGAKEAEASPLPAPVPTRNPQTQEQAENVGDADIDAEPVRDGEAAPQPVQPSAAPATPEPEPEPEPEPVTEPADTAREDTPAPATELAALNEPAAPVREEPVEEAQAEPEAVDEEVQLPDNVPTPTARPDPPKPQTAKTTERKTPDQTAANRSQSNPEESDEATLDQISALINRQDPSAAGAKRSERDPSLGTNRPSSADQLSQSEMDALRAAIEQCWLVPIGMSGAEEMRVTITMDLDKDGRITGAPRVAASGGEPNTRRAFAESARRAVLRCAPYNLPKEKYDTWSKVVVNFDPSDMF